MSNRQQDILHVKNLKMHFPVYKGFLLRKPTGVIKAVDGVSFSLRSGETLGLVGESGCGKSTLSRALMRLYQPTSGEVTLLGTNILTLKNRELLVARRHLQMVFQDPYASLNPRMTVSSIIKEALTTHKICNSATECKKMILELLDLVGLSRRFINHYPHEFSGGQRQRIAIARALAIKPKIIICDEAISALDVSIQAQILNLFKTIQQQFNISYIFISHNIAAVRYISHRIAVMYLGKIVEIADSKQIITKPKHPYTKALLSAVSIADPKKAKNKNQIILKGEIPSPLSPPTGCSFHTRCLQVTSKCLQHEPPISNCNQHLTKCWLYQN